MSIESESGGHDGWAGAILLWIRGLMRPGLRLESQLITYLRIYE